MDQGDRKPADTNLRLRRMPHAGVWRHELARRLGEPEAGRIIALAAGEYGTLYTRRPRWRHLVLWYHVTYQMLPALALYRALGEAGWMQEAALEQTLELAWLAIGPLYRTGVGWLGRVKDPFSAWRKVVRFAMATIFPPAGWGRRLIADDGTRYAFDIIDCVYLRTLQGYGAPELTGVFCRVDDRLAGLLPRGIRWARQGTLGMGQDRCDFCWHKDQGSTSKTGPSRQTS